MDLSPAPTAEHDTRPLDRSVIPRANSRTASPGRHQGGHRAPEVTSVARDLMAGASSWFAASRVPDREPALGEVDLHAVRAVDQRAADVGGRLAHQVGEELL